MSKSEKQICGASLIIIGTALMLWLPEAATAGLLFCVWGALALAPRKRRTKSYK